MPDSRTPCRPRNWVGAGLVALLGFFLPLAAGGSLERQGQAASYDSKAALEQSQQAIGRQLGDYALTTGNGDSIALASLRGKPLVLSLVYTSCYHICPMTTKQLAKVVTKAREALGNDSFRVATFGFDAAHDTPESMRQFARNQGVAGADWLLLSASDQATAEALMRDLGFSYVTSPRGFDHIIQATVIDGEGRIYRQVYGEVFETPQLVEPLKELVFGQPRAGEPFFADLLGRIRLFCTTYDPSRDAYYFDLSLFIGMAVGASILLGVAWFVIREYAKSRRLPRS